MSVHDRIETELIRISNQLKKMEPAAMNWISVIDKMPPKHARYRIWREGVGEFVATPCYGMHEPWWVPRNSFTKQESEPIGVLATDYWRDLAEGPSTPHP